jgi:hypothetical protein
MHLGKRNLSDEENPRVYSGSIKNVRLLYRESSKLAVEATLKAHTED